MTSTFEIGKSIITTLLNAGFESYFTGGCVRDMVMNITPQDYDIATAADVSCIKKLFRKTVEVGASFGVILVIEQGMPFQVAHFRGNSPLPEDDAHKRDFTINGLFYDYIKDQIIDYVHGRQDIGKKIIRAIDSPHNRFTEDPLRMLRAVRLATTLRFEIENETLCTLTQMAHLITNVSIERIRNELLLLCSSGNISYGLDLLIKTNLLEILFPEYDPIANNVRASIHALVHHTTIHHYFIGIPALLYSLSHELQQTISQESSNLNIPLLKRLKLSADDSTAIRTILGSHARFIQALRVSIGQKKKWMQTITFLWELEFHKLLLHTQNKPLTTYTHLKKMYDSLSYTDLFPQPLISGTDLIKQGFSPSPSWSELFKELEIRHLDGTLTSSKDAIDWAKTFLS